MGKNYDIRQSQLDELVKTKKERKLIAESILKEVDDVKSNLKNVDVQNEAVIDVLKKHYRRGRISKPIAKMLIENGVDNKDLLLVGMKLNDIL